MRYRRENRGLPAPNGPTLGLGLSLPFGGINGPVVVMLVTLLTLLQIQREAGPLNTRGAGVASAALAEFCILESLRIEMVQTIENQETGNERMECRGNVTLTSCQGQCISSVAPSVITKVGFVKKCTCCREAEMRSLKVRLSNCILDDGSRKTDFSHEVLMQEPSRCACQPCNP